MSNVFRQFYYSARDKWFQQWRKGLRARIERRYGQSQDPEIKEVVGFLRNHPELEMPMHMVPPYEWVRDYRAESVVVERDAGNGLLYATVNGHRIFFPRKATIAEVQEGVATGQMERTRGLRTVTSAMALMWTPATWRFSLVRPTACIV